MKNKKIFLFIDGSNLYASQYDLFGPDKFLEFSIFLKKIENKLRLKFHKIYFYASYSPKSLKPTNKEKGYLKNEALFYKSAKKVKDLEFFTGYRSKTSGKEKEVDVKLTADLVSLAFLNRFDVCYLFTGDADFLQALFNIKRHHNRKSMYLICMENKIMYKGSFYFKTFIVSFNHKQIKFHKKQTVEFLNIESREVVEEIK